MHRALIDSGACASILPMSFTPSDKSTKTFKSVNGSMLNAVGTLEVNMTIDNYECVHEFFVADIGEIILGYDFLFDKRILVDVAQNSIRTNNGIIAYFHPPLSINKFTISSLNKTTSTKQLVDENLKLYTNDWRYINQIDKLPPTFILKWIRGNQILQKRSSNPVIHDLTPSTVPTPKTINNSITRHVLTTTDITNCNPPLSNTQRPNNTPNSEVLTSDRKPSNVHSKQLIPYLLINSLTTKIIKPNVIRQTDFLTRFPFLFNDVSPGTRAPIHNVTHKIPLFDNPKMVKPYRLAEVYHKTVKEMFDKMLSNNIIRPSSSYHLSPLLVTTKKNGKLRPCIDYRQINAVTIPDRYPLPRIDEIVMKIKGKVFSTYTVGSIRILTNAFWSPQCSFDIPKVHGQSSKGPNQRTGIR
jgi:hypothetical protein